MASGIFFRAMHASGRRLKRSRDQECWDRLLLEGARGGGEA